MKALEICDLDSPTQKKEPKGRRGKGAASGGVQEKKQVPKQHAVQVWGYVWGRGEGALQYRLLPNISAVGPLQSPGAQPSPSSTEDTRSTRMMGALVDVVLSLRAPCQTSTCKDEVAVSGLLNPSLVSLQPWSQESSGNPFWQTPSHLAALPLKPGWTAPRTH